MEPTEHAYYEILNTLQIMLLQRCHERYIFILMYKIFHNLVPNDPQIIFHLKSRILIQAYILLSRRWVFPVYSKQIRLLNPHLRWWLLDCGTCCRVHFMLYRDSTRSQISLPNLYLLFSTNLPCLASPGTADTHC